VFCKSVRVVATNFVGGYKFGEMKSDVTSVPLVNNDVNVK